MTRLASNFSAAPRGDPITHNRCTALAVGPLLIEHLHCVSYNDWFLFYFVLISDCQRPYVIPDECMRMRSATADHCGIPISENGSARTFDMFSCLASSSAQDLASVGHRSCAVVFFIYVWWKIS